MVANFPVCLTQEFVLSFMPWYTVLVPFISRAFIVQKCLNYVFKYIVIVNSHIMDMQSLPLKWNIKNNM